MKTNTSGAALSGPRYHERADAIFSSTLTATERIVLLAISHHLGASQSAWPGMGRLSGMTGLSRRSVMRAVCNMERAGLLTIERSSGTSNRYRVDWLLVTQSHQCHSVTSDTESPVPVTQSHPTSDTVSPEQIKNNSETVQKKRTRKSNTLTIEGIEKMPLPEQLASLDGFFAAWMAWVRIRQQGRGRWREAAQVERMLGKLASYHDDGLDVLDGLERAYDRSWQGISRSYLKPRQDASPTTKTATDAEQVWSLLIDAMGRVGSRRLPTPADIPGLDADTITRAIAALGGPGRWSALCQTHSRDLQYRVRPQFVRSWGVSRG